MMIRNYGSGLAALALLGAASVAFADPAGGPKALGTLETGLWEIKGVGTDMSSHKLCVSDMRQLLQPVQIQPMCKQFISDDAADHVTASFDCAAQGQGRTSVRVETSRLVQIDSQGISGGRPFAARMEGRRVGACQGALR
jgi:hypothetical protein